MKILFFIALMAFIAIKTGASVPDQAEHKKHNLGSQSCTWGPSYWCQNLTSAGDCHATKHCIQTVWIHKQLPPDHSSVCQICLDMVKQARDQLESNETQDLIKQVFEGSCALIHLKPIVNECDKIVDQYIPDLIDTLASQMNPQVVCSVAGLCNNEKVHKLLARQGEEIVNEKEVTESKDIDKCAGCRKVVGILETRFGKMSKDEVLQSLLGFCGQLGSFSDGCSNIIITYFNQIYSNLQDNLNADEICLLSGECSTLFHTHDTKVEITPISHIGYVSVNKNKDDLPCELCRQLVQHLRELLIANTTEEEFKRVLEGLCKQSGQFADECVALVGQYYSQVYSFLVSELNSTTACQAIGICPSSGEVSFIAPLLPAQTAKLAQTLTKSNVNVLPELTAEHQLPIDLLVPPHTQVLYNKEVCEFCQYFLHYVQVALTEPKTEEKIRKVIDEACDRLPSVVNATCRNFVDNYEPALVAVFVQEIDPTQICPLIRACPSSDSSRDVEVFMEAESDSKCPLCLVAVTKLEELVKNNKSKESIKSALKQVCGHFPRNMAAECSDLVDAYSDELVEMLMADLKPSEVCVFLKLCTDDKPASSLPPFVVRNVGGDIETNVIPDNTINGRILGQDNGVNQQKPTCVICEFVMKEIEDQLKDKKTDDEIEQVVRDICNVMPKSVKKQCNDFVNDYGDTVIQAIIAALEPSEICTVLKLCTSQIETIRVEILECPICQMTAEAMKKILENPKVDHDIEHVLEKTCRGLPDKYRSKCTKIIETHGKDIINLLIHHSSVHEICKELKFCSKWLSTSLVGVNRCTYGPSYWCENEQNADECDARVHCESKVWNQQISKRQLVGANPCTRGPAYWCASVENADKCNAKSHCETKVWNQQRSKRDVLVGANPCTRGPAYWCKSEENADECGQGARTHCESKVWNQERSKRALGADPCTRGPAYWCASVENADKCNARSHCETKVWNQQRSKRDVLVGANPCTRGPSYWCKSEENADECGQGARTHCESKVWNQERSKRALGADPCTRGPAYWCASAENADKCNAKSHCETKVWNQQRSKRALGADPCTRGPAYWCASVENADKCNAKSHCETKVWNQQRSKRALGANPCTRGPAYWCASAENADKCNAKSHCETKVWNQQRSKRALGADPCTRGPAYWCASAENADKCNAKSHCETKVWNQQRSKRALGADPCTRGPAYWCASVENADKCNAKSHCETKVWNQQRSKRDVLVGANPCTRGPAYWCKSEENADECGQGARTHCESKVWNQERSKRALGADPCTRGPAYWCASVENADKCNAKIHCETKVWNQQRSKRGVLVGANPCTRGPAYWCKSEENADECGQGARTHCESKVWNQQRSKRALGADPCTRGPAYWCASVENADKCNAKSHCETKVWNQQRSKRALGADPCTRGPAYWCASVENADKCNAKSHCETKVWNQRRSKRGVLVGANPCTRGPAYWCKSEENADECGQGARTHCESKVWNQQRSERALGADPCTRGPAYWCASAENADKCNAKSHCETKVWNQQRSKRALGADPCTRGPAYWCASVENADKCNAKSHCETKVWNQQRSKRALGANPCTRGPAYWCASAENADKCNAKSHCETKVWNQQRSKRDVLLGADPCTWGPSYWCESAENANKCGARAHCESKVWNGPK